MHILDLSDEVLVLIFEYMTGQDKVNLFETCNRFNQLLKDRKLVGKLSFHGCFTTSMIDINVYLKPKICRENVTELNLTSCYWLRSMDIRTCVVKLTNLEALYAADTPLSLQHVLQILRTLPQLKKLSWSWGNMDVEQVATWNNMDNLFKQIDAVSSKLTSLEFLFLYLKTEYFAQEDMYLLNRWLMHCSGLQELWVLVPFFLSGIYIPEYVGSCHFPNLHTVVTNLPDNPLSLGFIQSLSNMIFNGCSSETSWRYLWIPFFESGYLPDVSKIRGLVTCRHTYVALNTCRDIEQLAVQNEAIQIQSLNLEGQSMKKLLCGKNVSSITWDSLWTSFTSLEELNIRVCVENIINVYNQSNLSKLALPTCILQGTGITSTSRATGSYSVMKVLVETCPNIKEFEFTQCISCVYSPAFKDQELSLILLKNWKQLRRIKLSGLPCVLSGKSFQQIFISCEKLESISLKHLGLDGKCGYLTELYKSLSCCRNLKDFRIEQPNIISLDVLILALAKCPSLERICIISLRHSKLSHYRVLRDLVVELPNLIFLCVVMDILTKERCKVISKDITERCKAARPGLHVMLHHCALTAEFLVDIPGVHYFEMVEDVSQICTKPGNGGRYKYLFHT